MVYLTNGILKNCYEKCITVFERVIDCNMHINAYVGSMKTDLPKVNSPENI